MERSSKGLLLSVIIPAYNVERTLARCVESVLAQGVGEVIIIDDGSTDDTPRLCDQYAGYPRVTVIHQSNGGLSAARNTGLSAACGEYVTFVDSDDFISPNTYPRLLKLIGANPQYDILEYSLVKDDVRKRPSQTPLPDREYTDMAEYWIDGRAYAHSYACNKLFRRSLFDHVRFPVGKTFEDVHTLPQLLRHARTVRTTSIGTYHYAYNPDGITSRASADDHRNLLEAHMGMIADSRLRHYHGFAKYYAHVLNIQITAYERSGDDADIALPTLPYYGSWKLQLLHVLGMHRLCHLFRTTKRLLGIKSN